jgi:hypothetical protein
MPLDRSHYQKGSQGQKLQPHSEMLKLVHVCCVIKFIMCYVSLLIYSVCKMLFACTYVFHFMRPVKRGRTDQDKKDNDLHYTEN